MTIYMLEREVWEGEDQWGRPEYRDEICEEYGYFTSREDAQAWINKRIEKARKDHVKFEKLAQKRHDEWQAELDKHNADMAEVQRLASEKGIKVQAVGFRKTEPSIPKFVAPFWEIVEIEPNK